MNNDEMEDFVDFFNEEMVGVWTGAAEFGYLVDDKDIAALPLERLMLLREEWPDQAEAVTAYEYSITAMLDMAIMVCFVALGVVCHRDNKGHRGVTTIPENPNDAEDVAIRRAHREMANRLADGINEALNELKNFTAEELNETSDEWNASRELIRAADAAGRDADDLEWWEMLGWPSLNAWKARHRDMTNR